MIQRSLRDPAIGLRKALHKGRGAFLSIFLFSVLIAINFAMTAGLLIRPFSRLLFRRYIRFIADSWWGFGVSVALIVTGTKLIITGDEIQERDNAILVANHQEMPDIYAVMIFAKTKNRLGDLKWFVKDSLKYVPGIGWGMQFMDCLFVKRNWDTDASKIKAVFSKIQTEKIPVWLISFVEGTRITQEKVLKSQKYARDNQLPVFENVLLPRTKGFLATVQGLGGHARAIYDVTIAYPSGIPTLWQITQGLVPQIHFNIRRYSIDELPQSSNDLSSWLVNRFSEKDDFINRFTLKC